MFDNSRIPVRSGISGVYTWFKSLSSTSFGSRAREGSSKTLRNFDILIDAVAKQVQSQDTHAALQGLEQVRHVLMKLWNLIEKKREIQHRDMVEILSLRMQLGELCQSDVELAGNIKEVVH